MERHGEKISYSTLNLLQDILSLLVIFFLSFPKIVKEISHYLLHSKQGQGLTPVYPSLRTKSIPSSCTYVFDQDTSAKPHKKKDHPYETHGATIYIYADTTHLSHQEKLHYQRTVCYNGLISHHLRA